MICSTGTPAYAGRKLREVNNSPPAAFYPHGLSAENDGHLHKVGSINSIFYFLHKAAEPFNCLEQDNLA